MDDPFDFPALRVQQPGKLLADRARYEIFGDQHQLVAVAAETEAHTRMKLLAKSMPDARVLAVTTAAGEPLLTLVKHTKERVTELQGGEGQVLGRIRATHTTRHYTLLDSQGQTMGKAVGDLALKHFGITGPNGSEFARVRKTWAGLRKEVLTASDHYKVEFVTPVFPPARTLAVMLPIVLDLTLYGPI